MRAIFDFIIVLSSLLKTKDAGVLHGCQETELSIEILVTEILSLMDFWECDNELSILGLRNNSWNSNCCQEILIWRQCAWVISQMRQDNEQHHVRITKLYVRAKRIVLRIEMTQPKTKQAMKPLTLVLHERVEASRASPMIPLSSSAALPPALSSLPRRARFNLSIIFGTV